MRPDVTRWYARRTSAAADWPAARLRAARGGTTVAVVLPALDEEDTVGDVVRTVVTHLGGPDGLVDDVVVMDSGSTDRTAAVADAAGARVVHRDAVLPGVPAVPGKGEVLWRSLAATGADLLCFCDADLRRFSSRFVTGLLGPLLTDPSVALVKGTYGRPLDTGDALLPAGGGRVTELVARPLLNLHWPELAGFVQPLAGEYAARRSLLERLPFPCGYGVELGLLVDALGLVGLDALAQVDLGVRHHRHRHDADLGRMSAEIWRTALTRLHREGRVTEPEPAGTTLTQFTRAGAGEVRPDGGAGAPAPAGTRYRAEVTDVAAHERPPIVEVAGYAAREAS